MPLEMREGVLALSGDCAEADAEALAEALREAPPPVDLTAATRLHAAVLQCLMALGPTIVAPPAAPGPASLLSAAGLAAFLADEMTP
jgi:hypothetical protein